VGQNPKLFDGDLDCKVAQNCMEDKFDATNVAVYFEMQMSLKDPY
jgi:hypothetical protein